jgi:peptide/nickel transport system substrate-binding protein
MAPTHRLTLPVRSRKRLRSGTAILVTLSIVALALGAGLGAARPVAMTVAADPQLVVDTQFDHLTADPSRDSSISGRYILGSVYDTLTAFKQRGTKLTLRNPPVPWLATSWRSNAAGTVWTFELRRGVRFSNGDPLTSADVVFTLRRIQNLKAAPAFLTDSFKSVDALGRYRVRIVTNEPNPAIPHILANKSTGIVDSKVARENGATDAPDAATRDQAQTFFNAQSIGSGPYVLSTFSTTDQTVIVRNPRFWGPKPHYGQIVFRNVRPEVGRLDVQTGQAQIALGLLPAHANGLSGNVKVYSGPSSTVFYLQANANPAISSLAANRHLWQAIRYGIDYQKLVRLVGGGAVQACGLIPRQFLGALPASACVKRDVARARAELERTGLSDRSLTLEFSSGFSIAGVPVLTMAQQIQADLAEVGLDLRLMGLPSATSFQRWSQGQAELRETALAALYPDPNMATVYLPIGFRGQYAGYKSTDAPDLTALGRRAQRTLDLDKRAALFRQLQIKLNQESPFFPQIQPREIMAVASSVRNVIVNPAYIIDPPSLR